MKKFTKHINLCGLNLSNFSPGSFKKLFLFNLIFFISFCVSAQNKVHVTGVVKDDKGTPASNVSVTIKGSKGGVTTNADGAFSLDVPSKKSTLIISNVGYQSQEIPVGTTTNFSVSLAPSVNSLSEVVVVGYGTQKKVTLTGAVAQVKGSELQKSPAVNLSNSIAGRLPGVVATNRSGEPGYDGSAIHIRGVNSLGSNDALIVIDGVPARAGGLDRLNPADIESMSVLKDASGAIYGARAANGVILITTKHGKAGKPELSYSFNQGWGQPTIIPKMLDAVEYSTMANEIEIYKLDPSKWADAAAAYKATGSYTDPVSGSVSTAPFQPADIEKYKDGSDPWGHP
ncbi:MAG: TonB-dependent receptor plug domain-containing protein, partial [Ginsengibacter sp.]